MSNDVIFIILNVALLFFVVLFLFILIKDVVKHKKNLERKSSIIAGIIGLISGFFDAFKIGSLALTTVLLRATKQCDDGVIPGTLNVSLAVPTALGALLFFKGVEVDPITLALMIIAAVIGAWLGAGIISKLSKKIIQIILGIALIVTAIFMILSIFDIIKSGESTSLIGIKLIIGVVCNFFLGALMTAGVEIYAPCIALVYLLGMSADASFPIMMGSSAFLIQVAGIKFIREGKYARKTSLVINILGCCGVAVAFLFFGNLSWTIAKWVIIAIILYGAINMIMASQKQQVKNSIK